MASRNGSIGIFLQVLKPYASKKPLNLYVLRSYLINNLSEVNSLSEGQGLSRAEKFNRIAALAPEVKELLPLGHS